MCSSGTILMSVLFPPFGQKTAIFTYMLQARNGMTVIFYLYFLRGNSMCPLLDFLAQEGRRGDSKNCKMIPNTGGFPEPRKTCE
jgi:hypothetical protein